MRLLRLKADGTFSLTLFRRDDFPPYAILSHTWGPGQHEDEVTFRDLVDGTGNQKVGFQKLQFCSEQAERDGLHYSWIDSCCI
jgi:hypothetical protein